MIRWLDLGVLSWVTHFFKVKQNHWLLKYEAISEANKNQLSYAIAGDGTVMCPEKLQDKPVWESLNPSMQQTTSKAWKVT